MTAVPHGSRSVAAAACPRSGLTLVELLIAAVLSLLVMGAVASLFGILGRSIRQSQATIDLGAVMRSAAWQLRQDLTGLTCTPMPWLTPERNVGYFELIEGPLRDASLALDTQGQPTTNLGADTDDILLFTTQSLAEPFVGRYQKLVSGSSKRITIESPYAEVAWFCRPAASQPVEGTTLYDLHRRQLLVTSYLGDESLQENAISGTADRALYDLSLRPETIAGQGAMLVPNSLGDLTKRENRFMRCGLTFVTDTGSIRSVAARAFPFAFPVEGGSAHALAEATLSETSRAGEDVILTNVIAFDVRVYDPQAVSPVRSGTVAGSLWRHPGDPGYPTTAPAASGTTGLGAYVDLGWQQGSPAASLATFPPAGETAFGSAGCHVAGTSRLPVATYDTWSRHYESNGIDDDGDGTVDEGTAGVDADADGWLEYSPDSETSPPYPVVLRGVEVRLRCYEPRSKQVRQVTIRHAFPR